ncbi:hypothetical protein [Rhodococcus sp. IEGM 1408]|uniref:hypothetical protein n=1 Tax=Rhodococcus sp. IEGM 1408 TaxID=3082220 RepID=UPI002952FAEE|nr:hypothetical protein [Rhodococcus sp. IEGM 1408]MDV8002048.1 hypothetical protein [Rhodococcus sp. IEGM 1408]
MRPTALMSTLAAALAAGSILAGAGTAAAQEVPVPTPTDLEVDAGCVDIETFGGVIRCMNLDPALAGQLGSLGYGSLGTGSLLDLLTGVINTGSTTLSLDVPNSTGSYAPGSLGSYGPEASIGELSVGSLGSLAGAS